MHRLCLPLLLVLPLTVDAADLTPLNWLAGCWQQSGQEDGSVEHWMAPAGDTLLGMSRTLRPGKATQFEFMQIRSDPQAGWVFVAQPQGRPPTEFALLKRGEQELVFENLRQGFPQRVMYRLAAPGRLLARIEGDVNGQLKGIDFPMERRACP